MFSKLTQELFTRVCSFPYRKEPIKLYKISMFYWMEVTPSQKCCKQTNLKPQNHQSGWEEGNGMKEAKTGGREAASSTNSELEPGRGPSGQEESTWNIQSKPTGSAKGMTPDLRLGYIRDSVSEFRKNSSLFIALTPEFSLSPEFLYSLSRSLHWIVSALSFSEPESLVLIRDPSCMVLESLGARFLISRKRIYKFLFIYKVLRAVLTHGKCSVSVAVSITKNKCWLWVPFPSILLANRLAISWYHSFLETD